MMRMSPFVIRDSRGAIAMYMVDWDCNCNRYGNIILVNKFLAATFDSPLSVTSIELPQENSIEYLDRCTVIYHFGEKLPEIA